jgi:hypothetical protein
MRRKPNGARTVPRAGEQFAMCNAQQEPSCDIMSMERSSHPSLGKNEGWLRLHQRLFASLRDQL